MWAMIPMLRTRSSPTRVSVAATTSRTPLPAVVREGLVGLRHPIDVVLALERTALLFLRVYILVREPLAHPLLAALACELDEPADGERPRAPLRHLDRHLVVRTADAAALHLEHGRHRLHGLLEHLDRRPPGLRLDLPERVVDDLLGRRLLARKHDLVDDLRHELRAVHGVGSRQARLDLCAARHVRSLALPRTSSVPACGRRRRPCRARRGSPCSGTPGGP